MSQKHVLISGANIAGPTLAYWLHRYGFKVTVVEQAPGLRLGGQNIDVKGPAEEVAKLMGIEEAIRDKNTTEIGTRFVTITNKTVAEFPKGGAFGLTQELEILRGDLVNILVDLTKQDVDYRFGDQISDIKQTKAHAAVTFASGKKETFDLVIAADGLGSATRDLVLGKPGFKYTGLNTVYLTIDKTSRDSRWARWCNAPTGVVFLFRPDNYGQTRASATFLAKEDEYKDLDLKAQKEAISKRLQGVGWEADRLIESLKTTDDLYFERVSQVKAKKWHEGRFALLGDAAWCVTPIAGKGTDLAMAGAYILAGELYKATDHEQAFKAYEKRMRPYVKKAGQLPPGLPNLVYPTSRLGVGIFNAVIATIGSKPVKWLSKLLQRKNKNVEKEIELPDYLTLR